MYSPRLYLLGLVLLTSLIAAVFIGPVSAETYDVDPETGFRMERYRAPVPQSIPGGVTVDTAKAMEAHKNGEWVFIDVYAPKGLGPDPLDGSWLITESRESLPGASWLPEVGRGHVESDSIEYFQRNLEALTNGDKSQALVLFCTSDCWQSWNAARRAIQWGYSAVHWYPLGSDGWQDEGGTLDPIEPVNFFGEDAWFPETATIFLVDQNNQEHAIGAVEFIAIDDEKYTISVTIESPDFSDQFLSMRPFDCIAEAAEWYCYLPYPYELQRTVTKDDLTELEYQLLFIWKSPRDFGIDAWNGVYYQLSRQDNGSFVGELLQGDLNVLADPPEPYSHPIDLGEFINEGSDSRRFPQLIIRP